MGTETDPQVNSPGESQATQTRDSIPDLERNIKTAQHGHRETGELLNRDLQVPEQENGDDIDKGMTGSVTELSMNDKMHKPMLPPID